MKEIDPQLDHSRPLPELVLHCLAMPVIVLLRRDIGFWYLKPFWIFFTAGYALGFYVAFAYLSREENLVWRLHWPALVFFSVATVAYTFHVVCEFIRQHSQNAQHDKFSGWLNLAFLARPFAPNDAMRQTYLTLFVVEPAILVICGVLAHLFLPSFLGKYLMIAAVALGLKAYFNYWNYRRKVKRQDDAISDAEDRMGDSSYAQGSPLHQASGAANITAARKPRQKVPRRRANSDVSPEDRRFAEILGIEPPYTLEKARGAYRALALRLHSDTSGDTDEAIQEENDQRLAEAHDAYQYFKLKFSEADEPKNSS